MDLVQVSREDFLQNRKGSCDDPKLAERISEILDNLPCFNDYSAFNSYTKTKRHDNHHKSHNNNNHHHNHHNHHHNHHAHHNHQNNHYMSMQRKQIINGNQKGVDREVTALLNKISKRNYNTVIKTILTMTQDSPNITIVMQNILDKCQKQPCFIEVYMAVILDISNRCSPAERDEVRTMFAAYIADFMHNREFNNYHLISEDYQEFCSNMDKRNMIMGKHKTVLALIGKIMRNNTIDEYFNTMFNEIIQMDQDIPKTQQEDTQAVHERHELLLDIMADVIKVDVKYRHFVEKYYTTHRQTLETYSLKARFKVMDMSVVVCRLTRRPVGQVV